MLIIDRLTPDCIQGSIRAMMALRRAELPEEKRSLFDAVMKTKLKKSNLIFAIIIHLICMLHALHLL